jgi:hypothetical protein
MVAISVYSLVHCAHCRAVTEHRRLLERSDSGAVIDDRRVCGSCGIQAQLAVVPSPRTQSL